MSGRWLNRAAVLWVLYEAPSVPPHLLATLLAVAAHTGPDGRGAYVSAATVAEITRKHERNAKRDLRALEERKLLLRGDQHLAAHIRTDRRPVVYDIPMPLRGGAGVTPSDGPRGGAQGQTGWRTGSDGVAQASPKEVHKTSGSGASRARAGGADAGTPENPHHPRYSAPPCPECGEPFSQEMLADPDWRAMALAGEAVHAECIEREPGS